MTPPVREVLTLDQLIAQLVELRDEYPEYGTRPVHVLNMAHEGDGLVTDVDHDCFDEGQGPVTSLLSGPPVLTVSHSACGVAQLATIAPWTRRTHRAGVAGTPRGRLPLRAQRHSSSAVARVGDLFAYGVFQEYADLSGYLKPFMKNAAAGFPDSAHDGKEGSTELP